MYSPVVSLTSLGALASLILLLLPAVTTASGTTCRSVTIPVTATTENLQMINLPDPADAAGHAAYFVGALLAVPPNNGTRTVTGTYNIAATYCKPLLSGGALRDKKIIQVMVYGATYNREMWAGFGTSPLYNWHTYATAAGYHTLAIDRLGGGASQRPDPFQTVQSQLEVEIIHQIIASLRKPASQGGGIPSAQIPSFAAGGKVVYVGHSLGSTLGNSLSLRYPADVDAYVLTGFSSTFSPPINFLFDMYPAAALGISRLASLPYGYITSRTESIRTSTFYAGQYDANLAHVDFAEHLDTYTIGEGSTGAAMVPVPGYTGRVFLASGELDALFCDGGAAAGGATPSSSFSYDICKNILIKTRPDLYPNVPASRFGWYVAKKTGHSLALHYSAPHTIVAILKWLGEQGL